MPHPTGGEKIMASAGKANTFSTHTHSKSQAPICQWVCRKLPKVASSSVFICSISLWLTSVLFPCVSLAYTEVCGTIVEDTTWTFTHTPYIVTCDVLVSAGVTLRIEPGVTVKFDGPYALKIYGTLIARGTSGDTITFTTNSEGNQWGYILFEDSSADAFYNTEGRIPRRLHSGTLHCRVFRGRYCWQLWGSENLLCLPVYQPLYDPEQSANRNLRRVPQRNA